MGSPAGARGQQTLPLQERGGVPLFRWLTDNAPFKIFILICIIANSVLLGVDAHFGEANPWHNQIVGWDQIFLYIFTAELALEFLGQGPRRWPRDGWNWFDFIIVALSYLSSIPGVTALRTFRIFRVFRLISNVPQMRRVVEALIKALPGIVASTMVLIVVFFIGAVMATTLFRDQEGFGNLGESALSLFAVAQFDGWGETVVRLDEAQPGAWAFVLGFTIIAAFAVLNLFVGVIVDAVQETRNEMTAEIREDVADIEEEVEELTEMQEDAATMQKRILDELTAVRSELAALRSSLPPR